MAVKERSFWSTTNGVVTGVAGTLTGLVGIATVAAQLGWIGPSSDEDADETASGTTGAEGAPSTGSGDGERGGSAPASRSGDRPGPVFSVDPSSVRLAALGQTTATVEVRNTGDVNLSVEGVTVEGAGEERFSVSSGACTRAVVAPGRSCAVEVSFSPEGGGTATAVMVVDVRDARPQEVPLSGRGLL